MRVASGGSVRAGPSEEERRAGLEDAWKWAGVGERLGQRAGLAMGKKFGLGLGIWVAMGLGFWVFFLFLLFYF